MSEKFTASNGVLVGQVDTAAGRRFTVEDLDPVGVPGCRPKEIKSWLDPRQVSGLREFFLHERDQGLGRWRWPEHPDYVVYSRGDGESLEARAICERTSESTGSEEFWMARKTVRSVMSTHGDRTWAGVLAVRDFFDAHPLPKPWHDAKPGEVWVLTDSEDTKPAFVTDGGRFELEIGYCDLDCEDIIDAKRVWPEAVES